MASTIDSSSDEIMDVEQVAAFLRVNRKTIYNAVACARIPHRRLGRRIVISKQAVLDWLKGGLKETKR